MAGNPRKSRKPSGTKAESLLETSTFFVDRCLGNNVGVVLRQSGLQVEFHADHFADDAADETWISEVGRRGWIVLTKDKAIKRRSIELEAVKAAKVCMFTLSSGNMTGEEMGRIFVDNRLKMGRFIKNHPPPFIARVSTSGVVSVYPRSDSQTVSRGNQEPV
jgi:predicted nuclease of predicted toxin-antitoxin system